MTQQDFDMQQGKKIHSYNEGVTKSSFPTTAIHSFFTPLIFASCKTLSVLTWGFSPGGHTTCPHCIWELPQNTMLILSKTLGALRAFSYKPKKRGKNHLCFGLQEKETFFALI